MSANRPARRLGKGLAALLQPTADFVDADAAAADDLPLGDAQIRMIPCDAVQPSPYQPRSLISEESLAELAESIRLHGLIQPIAVRPTGDGYELIAGERRWRAARKAGLTQVPATIRDLDDRQMLAVALVENIFREDLNAIERARAYRRYCDEFDLTAEHVAEQLGEDRTTVVNYLRLLELPRSVQDMVEDGRLSMGHARSLAGMNDPGRIEKLAQLVITNFFSVRALEELIRREKQGGAVAAATTATAPATKRPHVRDLEQQFTRALSTKVEIKESRRKGSGRIVIHFYTVDDFDRVAERLGIRWE